MIPPFGHSRPFYTRPASVPADLPNQDDGVVRISLSSLIALHHAAESLPLKPGRIRSPVSGGYRSPFKGRGMEFDEVRPYMQGDDVRSLDWRVTARTGRPHTKLFREERERAVLLWVDLRHAMFFATKGAFKAVRAAQAAALLGWRAVAQSDRLGALLFSEETHIELRPRRGKAALLHVLSRIADHPAWQHRAAGSDALAAASALNQTLVRLRRVAQPGSLIILLSDFAYINGQGSAHLGQLARHNDLILADIHDPLEAELPPPGHYRVSDGERFLTLATEDPHLRERYRQGFIRRQTALQQLCRRYGMTLLPLTTSADPLAALQQGLGLR
ncbi:hypothetical protein TPL01_21120 [Sulfuriferula plumbiphila]|uniref:DUF58 domain-containing protein n=1 Tax=Sulfuriferula plumbiphila TaxID=171865 RepID=A0A512L922_9PROT|nr:DUF58 domain-containing protein [Sulfuriferula plumbiphila]BBP04409.1 hypothetical protein SFPGR_18310 [Sulfuriferula plumbiphila]GEP30974.1 hypothetical protein TPL01_21120 [Sulfuriferula plumbiphila]